MTLKQFGYLASGTLLAYLFYKTGLPFMFKWPLVLGCGFGGFAFAFMPIQERPLSVWLTAFIKSLFRPTIYVWKKNPAKLDIFSMPSITQTTTANLNTSLVNLSQDEFQTFLKTLPATTDTFDDLEKQTLTKISSLIEKNKTPTPPVMINQPPVSQLPPTPKGIAVKPTLNPRLPMPKKSERPNVLVGMVLDKYGGLVEGAIIEIRNQKGIPVRALKTSKLGQFFIATPLENGQYEIEVEKPNCLFDLIKIEVKGEVIEPLEIKAKKWQAKYPEEAKK